MSEIAKWFCHIHPQQFLSQGDCKICNADVNWKAKFEAGREYWKNIQDKKNEYRRLRRARLESTET